MKNDSQSDGNNYRSLKSKLLSINQDLAEMLAYGHALPQTSHPNLAHWDQTRQNLQQQIDEEVLRVAVVGAIKSGKSTFLNACLNGEFLKRGAGVVTSIVTRIRGGAHHTAYLYFKSWEDVNQEIVDAVAMLPTATASSEMEDFDIRQPRCRQQLAHILEELQPDQLMTNGTRNLDAVLLSCYLNGYDQIAQTFGGHTTVEYRDRQFREHWKFVGNDDLAVYLEDIQLEIHGRLLDPDVEYADCQGSDSPNPLHLARIQDYLNLSNLSIYLISSRTGLREADLKFLATIHKMGILDDVMFVINCDVSEHESLDDLQAVVERVENELRLVAPTPRIYTFSALYNLFKVMGDELSEKDCMRRRQWEKQSEITRHSDAEAARFQKDLKHRLLKERTRLLLNNQIERHRAILSGMGDWLSVNHELVSRDEEGAGQIIARIAHQQERMQQIKAMIETTSAGAVPKIKNDLSTDINRFFDHRSGECVGNIIQFIRNYSVDYQKYGNQFQSSGFFNTLNTVFQEFKHALNRAMTDAVYPEVVRFVREEEKKIEDYFHSLFQPYQSLVDDAHQEMQTVLKELAIKADPATDPDRILLPTADALKDAAGLKIPPLVSFMRYSAQLKTDAFMRLGFYSVAKVFRKLLRKPEGKGQGHHSKALQASVRRMKQLTVDSVVYQCKDYRENLKFGYVFKLVDIFAQNTAAALVERFQDFGTSTAAQLEWIARHKSEKEQVLKLLHEMRAQNDQLEERIGDLKRQVVRLNE
jgi:hypothetical protein